MIARLLLATGLGILAGAAAAAERPLAPAPESARTCPRHGPGFVEVPGTQTCIRIGGRVASEAGVATRRTSRDDLAGLRTTGRVSADVRTDTDYGPARAFVRMRASTGSLPDRR